MHRCPYRFQHCSQYFSRMQHLSAELAGNIEAHYCNDDVTACRRREAVHDGTLRADPDLSPWASPRVSRTADYA